MSDEREAAREALMTGRSVREALTDHTDHTTALRDQIADAFISAAHACQEPGCACTGTELRAPLTAGPPPSEITGAPHAIADAVLPVVEEALAAITHLLRKTEDELHAERQRAEQAESAIDEVRRLCRMTIDASCRAQAIDQAVDTLAVLDREMGQGTAKSALARQRERAEQAEQLNLKLIEQAKEQAAAIARAAVLASEAIDAWNPERDYHQARADRKGYGQDEAAAEVYGRAIEVLTEIRAALHHLREMP